MATSIAVMFVGQRRKEIAVPLSPLSDTSLAAFKR